MGRVSTEKTLHVWLNGYMVGKWKINSTGIHEFNYFDTWIDSSYCRPISLSLPLAPSSIVYKGPVVESFFDNLLPDSIDIRKRIQSRFGKRTTQAFDLLEEVGRDCVGAIQLLNPEITDVDIKNISGRKVKEDEIEKILLNVSGRTDYEINEDEFRISIAGAQEKTTLLWHDNSWKIPRGTTPSTHILKLPLGNLQYIDMTSSVENEWLCSKIIEAFSVPVAETEIGLFNEQKVLIVKRFDRLLSGDEKWIIRIPQEDMCQAGGTSGGLKYESDGGPGIKDVLDILSGSQNSQHDREIFFKSQILFWLLAAPDGHAKNFSIFLQAQGNYRLTPLYDVMSAYPVMGKGQNMISPQKLKMAMAVQGKNRHYHWYKIRYHHWIETGKRNGIQEKRVREIIGEIVETGSQRIESVKDMIPEHFPMEIADVIIKGFLDAVKVLKSDVM